MAASLPPQSVNIRGVTANNGSTNIVLAGPVSGFSFDSTDNIVTRRLKVFEHLRLTDPAHDRAELQIQKGRRVPGTCQWIENHPDYRNWLQGDCVRLWISGGPGTGKTMLSIFITESLEESNERVTYFFCRHDDEKRNTETAVLRGLLVQLLRNISDQSFDQHVWPSFHSDKAASYTLSGPQTIWNVFEALFTSRNSTPTFCILDGLDECDRDSSRRLAQRFHDLFARNESNHSTATFKLAVVSRDQSDLRGFSNLQFDKCDLHIRNDIELFIASNIRDALSHKTGFNEDILESISYRLNHLSEGSFLWVGFAVRDLSRHRNSRDVMHALERTPKGLEKQYHRILHHIFQDHEEERRHIEALLAWVALAFIPLTVPQLACAVMGFDSCTHHDHISRLLTYCEQLLVFSDKSGVVRLVHTSAKEFLVQPHSTNPSGPVTERTHVDDGHRTIARKCLKILEQPSQRDALKPYAIKFLPQHMKACKAADVSRELARPFFSAGDILQSQWEGWRSSQIYPPDFPEPTPSPLHIATYWGILPWAQQLLEARSRFLDIILRRNWLETKDEDGMTPLAIAVQTQDLPMVEWLLQQGAIVHLEIVDVEDVDDTSYATDTSPLALVFSSDPYSYSTLDQWPESRRMEIALLLLSRLHTRATWRSIRQSKALLTACRNPYDTRAQWLLNRFPPPENFTRTPFICPALPMAVRKGHVRVLEQLLDSGADIFSSWSPGYTALSDAIVFVDGTAMRETMLNLLFDEYDRLISTSGVGNQLDILLQPITYFLSPFRPPIPGNFCPNERVSFFKTECGRREGQLNALVVAAYYSRSLDFCLKRGNFGRFSDSGYSGGFELIAAVISDSIQTIMILLQNGANVNTVDSHDNSVLTLATRYGHWDVAATLISHGAEVDSIGDGDTTPLVEAVREKKTTLSRRLPSFWKEFFTTFRKKKLGTVLEILNSGSSPHRRTSTGDTALSLAASLGDTKTVSILAESGARIAIEDAIFNRGLWQWFTIFKILRIRDKLSNRPCSRLLAARLHFLAKDRFRPGTQDVYYHFEEKFEEDVLHRVWKTGTAAVHCW